VGPEMGGASAIRSLIPSHRKLLWAKAGVRVATEQIY
jgi:hypothetical protein